MILVIEVYKLIMVLSKSQVADQQDQGLLQQKKANGVKTQTKEYLDGIRAKSNCRCIKPYTVNLAR